MEEYLSPLFASVARNGPHYFARGKRGLPTASLISPRLSAIRRPISPIIHPRSCASRSRLSNSAQSPSYSPIINLVLRPTTYKLLPNLPHASQLSIYSSIHHTPQARNIHHTPSIVTIHLHKKSPSSCQPRPCNHISYSHYAIASAINQPIPNALFIL